MAFTTKEVGAYTGKEIDLYVKPAVHEEAPVTPDKIRGAQNFNPTEEKSETKVSEMGYSAQKTVYGTVNYSVATTLLVRDLLQIARMSGIPSTAKKLNVDHFLPVNAINYIKDPDTKAVVATVVSTGYKPRQANKSMAVEANMQITLDGAADAVITVQGTGYVRQYGGINGANGTTSIVNGINKCFIIDSSVGLGETNVLAVEAPSGQVLDDFDGYTFNANYIGTDGFSCIVLDTTPDNGSVVRIVYSKS